MPEENFPTRARGPQKIPRHIPDPKTGELVTLSKLQRGIIRRLPRMDTLAQVATEMKCNQATVSHTFHIPAVQHYLRERMEAAGITHGLIMNRLREGLDATKGKDKFNPERPDFAERREHAKLALRLQGLDSVPAEDKENNVNNISLYNIVINARQARGLDEKEQA